MNVSRERVMDMLYNCYDPEIPVNIVDLGLIYDVQVDEDVVNVKMTLTAQGCPAHAEITRDIKQQLLTLEGVREANVEIVWDPPWNPSRMSSAAREKLGIEI